MYSTALSVSISPLNPEKGVESQHPYLTPYIYGRLNPEKGVERLIEYDVESKENTESRKGS